MLSSCLPWPQSPFSYRLRRCRTSTTNLRASQSLPPILQSSFLHLSYPFRCIVSQNHLHKKSGTRRVTSTNAPLTTNHLLVKGDLWLTLILAVRKNLTLVRKKTTLTFTDLLYQPNEAFVRVQRRVALLEQIGIFDPLIMQTLNRQSETLRAGANCHLLGAMRRIEERDRERFSQPPNELNP